MSETNKTETMPIEKAFRFAVIQAWDELAKVTAPHAIRVEYVCEPGTLLDHVSVWLVKAGGYQELVCDYWTWASSAHPSGLHFGDRYRSEKLARALDYIMKNQGQFRRGPDAIHYSLVPVFPPTEDESAEAAAWVAGSRS